MKNEKFAEAYFKLTRKDRYHTKIRDLIVKECDISLPTFYNWIRSISTIPHLAKPVIARILNTEISELFEMEETSVNA